jgi:nucleotide-binding universal stress UspA family protein
MLAKRFNAEVTLIHVLPPYALMGPSEMGMTLPADVVALVKTQAEQRLESFLKEELMDLHVKRVLIEGDPARRIVEFAHSQQCDLILMPTHGYGPFRRLLLGSVTSKVLHDADCAVWTGVHFERESHEPMSLSHIVCAIDLGPHSVATLSWANQLAAEFHSRLTLVHVVASLDPRTEDYYFAPEWRKYLTDKAREEVGKLQKTLGVPAEAQIEVGDIAKAVCLAAQQLKADLLVIGRGSVAGSIGRFRAHAHALIRQSPCPVVSV